MCDNFVTWNNKPILGQKHENFVDHFKQFDII